MWIPLAKKKDDQKSTLNDLIRYSWDFPLVRVATTLPKSNPESTTSSNN